MASSSNSASASTTTSTADGNKFHVFLNHGGPDVKKTFATDLYNQLKKHRLQVFLDMEEMKKGEKLTCQIERAIDTASVQIAIFSINYAESSWCLDELLLMLKSMQEKKSTILPIFFGVKPSEVRWTKRGKGVYAQALRSLQNKKRKHDSLEPRFDSSTIGKWKKALYDVASISGFELEAYNGDEEKLLADVVERVLKIIPKPLLDVSKYPTGLADKVTDFEKTVLLQTEQESGKARVVGIVGLGGVGKTTLAKEFYNRAGTNYRRSCFLSDVRENVRKRSLNSLQSILIKELTQRDVQLNNTDEGVSYLKEHLRVSQALIILDDMDHIDQLDALLSPYKDALGSSSLIIITSRDKGVLQSWGIKASFIYKLEGLNPQHSRELFCLHAFHQSCPVSGFEQVVNEFLQNACSGLPLSLKVMGSILYGEDNIEHWKAQLLKISKLPPEDIQKRLRISYDSLDEEEKQMFLDIACFFIGEDKDTAIQIWDGSGWQGSLGFQNLQQKSLVEVEVIMKGPDTRCWLPDIRGFTKDVSVIRMHDQLRDLGRYLAHELEPWRRIWRVTDKLLDQSHVLGIKNVEERNRLVTQLKFSAPVFLSGGFPMRTESGIFVESVFSVGQSPQLILLRCYNCLYCSLPSSILVENLRVLYIEVLRTEREDVVERLWHESEAPMQLRELHIKGCILPKIPESTAQLKHLEKIIITANVGCSLETFPDEFCRLRSLKHLQLQECIGMKSLPDSFGNLTNLQYVGLPDCNRLEIIPNSFGKLTKLQHIDLANCRKLKMLPNSFGNLIQLQYLCLKSCAKLTISEETLGKIVTLQLLDLAGCGNIKVLPPQLTEQLFLRELYLSYGFKKLPRSIGNLCNLKIFILKSSCLEMLPRSFGSLKSLEQLKLDRCPWKCFPDSIGMLTQLKTLSIRSMHNLQLLELKECPSRELTCKNVGGEFDSRGQGALSKLDASEVSYSNVAFPNLQDLRIQYCDSLVEVGALPTTLTDLTIGSCNRLRKIGGLCTLSKLETLSINYCIELEELRTLETLVSLEFLSTLGCTKLKPILPLDINSEMDNLDNYNSDESSNYNSD